MNRMSAILKYLGAIFLGLMTLVTGIDVIGRYLFNAPLPGGLDITINLLTLVAGCGIAATTIAEDHINVDSLYLVLPAFWKKWVRFLGLFLEAFIFSVLFWRGIAAVYHSITPFFEVSMSIPLPVFPFRLALAVTFLLSLIAAIYSITRLFRPKSGDRSDMGDGTSPGAGVM